MPSVGAVTQPFLAADGGLQRRPGRCALGKTAQLNQARAYCRVERRERLSTKEGYGIGVCQVPIARA